MSKEDRKLILDKAAACVLRDRNATHGEAEDNFLTIADYWTTHLRARGLLLPGAAVSREDVAIMSAQIKLARLAQSFDHEDNWVDGAGYMACGGGCAADRRRAGELNCPPVVPGLKGALRVAFTLEGLTLTDGNGMPAVTAPSPEDTYGVPGHPLYCACDRCPTAEYVDAKRKDARPENVHTKAPNLDNSVPFREGVLSPPPPEEPKAKCGIPCRQVCDECRLPCTCGGAHCAFCTPNAT